MKKTAFSKAASRAPKPMVSSSGCDATIAVRRRPERYSASRSLVSERFKAVCPGNLRDKSHRLRSIKTKRINRARIYLKSKELSPGFKKKGKSAAGQINSPARFLPLAEMTANPAGLPQKARIEIKAPEQCI